VKGMFFAIKAQIAAMRRGGGGSIVNLSSTGGSRGMPNMSIYVASKHAVEGLSRAVALEVAGANIRVNVVAPGPTLTPMLLRVTDGHPEALANRVPMGRAGAPEEVARAIVWVASDEASFVSGVVVPSTVESPRDELRLTRNWRHQRTRRTEGVNLDLG